MENDLNITPEMINNLVDLLKKSKKDNLDNSIKKDDENENKKDKSSINFENIISNISNNNSDKNNNSIDIETILKIKSIIETLNKKDDSRANLLNSLKPYLRKEKQDKLDQYINIMKISQVTNLFKKGENK